jgi:hypothetical protein
MIYLKYECKVNSVKLPLIWIYRCLKLIFENVTDGRQHRLPLGCEPNPPRLSPHGLVTPQVSR